MALTKTVKRLRPTIDKRNIATLGLHLEIQDDGVEVINADATETYAENQPIAAVKAEVKKKAQALIDKYIAEKKLYDKQAYINAITEIDSELDLTE